MGFDGNCIGNGWVGGFDCPPKCNGAKCFKHSVCKCEGQIDVHLGQEFDWMRDRVFVDVFEFHGNVCSKSSCEGLHCSKLWGMLVDFVGVGQYGTMTWVAFTDLCKIMSYLIFYSYKIWKKYSNQTIKFSFKNIYKAQMLIYYYYYVLL